jgi:hypothetical protein
VKLENTDRCSSPRDLVFVKLLGQPGLMTAHTLPQDVIVNASATGVFDIYDTMVQLDTQPIVQPFKRNDLEVRVPKKCILVSKYGGASPNDNFVDARPTGSGILTTWADREWAESRGLKDLCEEDQDSRRFRQA